jgi:hypothetical protein
MDQGEKGVCRRKSVKREKTVDKARWCDSCYLEFVINGLPGRVGLAPPDSFCHEDPKTPS